MGGAEDDWIRRKKTAGSGCQPVVVQLVGRELSASASAVESTSTMEAAATVESADCAVRSAMEAGCGSAVSNIATPNVSTSSVASSDKAAAVVAGASVEAAAVVAVIPRAGSNEDAVGEPTGSVVSVGRAGVWRVIIVAIGARWRSADVAGAESDANTDPDLRLGLDQRKRHQHTE